jgi:hypothetical protein
MAGIDPAIFARSRVKASSLYARPVRRWPVKPGHDGKPHRLDRCIQGGSAAKPVVNSQ